MSAFCFVFFSTNLTINFKIKYGKSVKMLVAVLYLSILKLDDIYQFIQHLEPCYALYIPWFCYAIL